MSVRYQPADYHTVSPYLLVADAAKMIGFLTDVFDAREIERHARADGSVGHAEVKIGDTIVMMGGVDGEQFKATAASLYVYVEDVDETYRRALKAGATSIMEPSLQFYGDKMGGVKDPAGNLLWIATHVEDVSKEEIARIARERNAG